MDPIDPPTHYCVVCGDPLWEATWPYAACRPCGRRPCPHGQRLGACAACDLEADLAYDAARERATFEA